MERTERFRRLFDACYQPLHGYARRRVSPGDADDLVADVLAIAWRRLDDIHEGAELPWLYGVARRTLANQQRAAGRRLRLVDRLGRQRPAGEDGPPTDSPVLDALERLRPDDREILRLAAWEQLGAAAIAVVLGCSPNAAALRLSRARRRLRSQLTESGARRTEQGPKVTDA